VVKTVGLLLRYFSALFLLYTFFLIFLNFIYNKVMSQSPILMVFLTKSTIANFFFFKKKKTLGLSMCYIIAYTFKFHF
jgi:hypothetical protein